MAGVCRYFIFGCLIFICVNCIHVEEVDSDLNVLSAVQDFCPNSIQCPKHFSFDVANVISTDEDCCGHCSCEPDCGRTQSCCLEEENEEYVHTFGKACVQPFVGDPSQYFFSNYSGVMMVTRCKDIGEQCSTKDGQLYVNPVSSLHEVYVNENCASCNHVNKFTVWKWKVIFDKDHNLNFRNMLQDPSSTRVVLPPVDHPVVTCHSILKPSKSITCTNSSMQELCRKVHLPYTFRETVYQNIFCKFCDYDKVLQTDACDITKQKLGEKKLTILFDPVIGPDYLRQYFTRSDIGKEHCPNGYIPHPFKTMCMPLFCPSYQLLSGGKCKHVGHAVFASGVAMILQSLSWNENPKPQDLVQLDNIEHRGPEKWIESPCFKYNWTNVRSSLAANSVDNQTHSLTIYLFKKLDSDIGTPLSEIYDYTSRCLSEKWTISMNTTKYIFNVDIETETSRLSYSRKYLLSANVLPNAATFGTPLKVDKLFYCHQVRLRINGIQRKGNLIYIESLNLTLGFQHFSEDQCAPCPYGKYYWICAEDFNPKWWKKNGHTVHNSSGLSDHPSNILWTTHMFVLLFCFCLKWKQNRSESHFQMIH